MVAWTSFKALYLSRLREFYRQPARIFWVYGFPMIMAVSLGLAFQNRLPDPTQVDLVANDASKPVEAALKAYESRAASAKKPGLVLKISPLETALTRLKTGKTPLVVEPLAAGPSYHFDPTRPEAIAAKKAIDDILQEDAGRVNPLKTAEVEITEPGSRYIDFLIPGLIGLNALGGGMWGIGFLIVNFRIGKLLKCFMATPMPRRNFLLAIMASRLTFLAPDLAVLLGLGVFGFGMPIRGSLLLVIVLDVVGSLAFAGIGLLIAARANSTEAVTGLMNMVMLPMWLLSGVFFSSERFPAAIQPVVRALPLTQLISALRMVILEGAGVAAVLPALGILAAWAVVAFGIALRIFKWT